MARKPVSLKIEGLEDLHDTLSELAPNESRNLLRAVTQGVATRIAKALRGRAPRATGTLAKAIYATRRRSTPDKPISEVRIEAGPGSEHDAFYWHFQEFGTVKQKAQPFVTPTVEAERPQLPETYRAEFATKLEKQLARKARKARK